MKPLLIIPIIAALALGACGGQSKSDKAKSQVCSARADISKQVNTLKGLTISSATTTQITDSVTAITKDLKTIAGAQGDLNSQRKSEVQAANQAFGSQITQIISSLGTATSIDSAKSQLTSAFGQLATAYQQTFAKVNCS